VSYDTTLIRDFCEAQGIQAMELVRETGISVSLAYKIRKGQEVKDLDVLYRVYLGLKKLYKGLTFQKLTGIS
jgi:transcriptional regulator with XRE-family HTH domain